MGKKLIISDEQKEYIKKYFWTKEKREIAKDLNLKPYKISAICKELNLTKSWVYDDCILINLCDGTRSYLDLQEHLSHRTRDAIEHRCQILKINHLVKRENSEFTIQEIEQFKLDFPIYTDADLMLIYNKTYQQIRRLAGTLKLNKNCEIAYNAKINNGLKATLINGKNNLFRNLNEYNIFINLIKNVKDYQHEIKNIIAKYNHLELNYIRSLIYKYHNVSFIYDKNEEIIYINNNSSELINAFKLYKQFLLGNTDCMGKIISIKRKDTVKMLFKYHMYKENISNIKDFLINCNYGEYLSNIKLDSIVEKLFNGYYDFITYCYPQHKLKPWDFKILDVSNDWYNNKFNIFWLIQEGIKRLIEDKIIIDKLDVFSLPTIVLTKYFGNSIKKFCGIRNAIIEYFNFSKINYDKLKLNYFNGIRFDSKEEMFVYIICLNFNLNIIKLDKKDKIYNEEYNEYYIPDFKIIFDNSEILCEYYGLFNEEKKDDPFILKNYYNKTIRKNIFYNNFKYFLPIYPSKSQKDFINNIKNQIINYFKINFNYNLNYNLKGGEI